MDPTKDILQGKWPELNGQVKQQWGKLTDDDLRQLSGKTEELAGVLRQRYGYGQVQAEIEINHWLRDHDQMPQDPAAAARKSGTADTASRAMEVQPQVSGK